MDLCEENYALLSRLVPGLRRVEGDLLSRGRDAEVLRLEVLEQTRYTTLVHLTYRFAEGEGGESAPDAELRVYHDARQAEIVELSQSALPLERSFEPPSLQRKWRANLFVSRWLEYCLAQGHHFADPASSA